MDCCCHLDLPTRNLDGPPEPGKVFQSQQQWLISPLFIRDITSCCIAIYGRSITLMFLGKASHKPPGNQATTWLSMTTEPLKHIWEAHLSWQSSLHRKIKELKWFKQQWLKVGLSCSGCKYLYGGSGTNVSSWPGIKLYLSYLTSGIYKLLSTTNRTPLKEIFMMLHF